PIRLWIEDTYGPATEKTLAGRDRSHLDVEFYLDRVYSLLRRVTEKLAGDGESIDALCPAMCCPAIVALDKNMRPLYPALTHLHRASQPQAKELADTIGRDRWLHTTGNLPAPGGISLSALSWLAAKRPHVVADAALWVQLHSVLIHSLTGNLVTEPTQAAYTGLYDVPRAGGWLDRKWLETFGVRPEQLPEIVPSASVAGKLTSEASGKSGLPQGLPVITGGADIPAGLLAAEELLGDSAALNMSGTTEIFTASCASCPEPGENFLLRPHLVPGRWMVSRVSPVGGQTLFWFHDRFCREMSSGRFWDWVLRLDVKVSRILEQEEPAAEGEEMPEFIPYIFGNRHSLEPCQGGFSGLQAETTREDMLCAVLVAYRRALSEAAQEVAAAVGRSVENVVTSGGFDISSLGFHRRAALSRFKLTPLEAAVVRGAAILAAGALEKSRG
ncbi:MAG: FGGY family carbohydrate kinase, partial [Gemmatimonadota bacterium]|nr:FGGY family carbohydrate kinase [Gemmatimonadota bacterium]